MFIDEEGLEINVFRAEQKEKFIENNKRIVVTFKDTIFLDCQGFS